MKKITLALLLSVSCNTFAADTWRPGVKDKETEFKVVRAKKAPETVDWNPTLWAFFCGAVTIGTLSLVFGSNKK